MMEDLLSQHRKEIKALDGEKRAAIKKAKSTKGKKAKDEISSVEDEYAAKLKAMEDRHRSELATLPGCEENADDNTNSKTSATTTIDVTEDIAVVERQKKLEKIREQKEAERQRIIDLERQSIEDAKNIGPTLRDVEMQQIIQQLRPLHFEIRPIAADGNCLYRAVAAQCSSTDSFSTATVSYQDMRALCAKTMQEQETEFAPFCEFNSDDITNYNEYVNAVQYNSHHWGGHLEIRALSMALHRPVHIYSSSTLHTNGPLIIDAVDATSPSTNDSINPRLNDEMKPIRLSYHLHYYALGEHYNEVVGADPSEQSSNAER